MQIDQKPMMEVTIRYSADEKEEVEAYIESKLIRLKYSGPETDPKSLKIIPDRYKYVGMMEIDVCPNCADGWPA